jgi:hypothetical protein
MHISWSSSDNYENGYIYFPLSYSLHIYAFITLLHGMASAQAEIAQRRLNKIVQFHQKSIKRFNKKAARYTRTHLPFVAEKSSSLIRFYFLSACIINFRWLPESAYSSSVPL